MTEAPHSRARAPGVPPVARALATAMRAVPTTFSLLLALTAGASLASGNLTQAAAFGGAFLLAASVAIRVRLLERP